MKQKGFEGNPICPTVQPYNPLNLQKHTRYNSLPLLTCIKYNIEDLIFCFLNIDIYCCASLYTHFDSGIRFFPQVIDFYTIDQKNKLTPHQEADTGVTNQFPKSLR